MKYLWSVLFTLLTLSLSAQEWDSVRYGTIGIHYQQVDFAGFNATAKQLGFPELASSMIDLSGGYTRHDGSWKNYYFFGLGLNEATAAGNGPETRYQFAGVGWSMAYNVLPPGRVWFFGPEFQMLFRGEQMILADRGQVSNPLNAIGTGYTKFTRFAAPLDLGVNLHHAIKFSFNKPNFLVLALRAGYRIDSGAGWQLDQAVDIEASGIDPSGLYVALRIGARLY